MLDFLSFLLVRNFLEYLDFCRLCPYTTIVLVRELVLCSKHIILARQADGDNNVVIE